jgi:hypothetical protein
VPYIKADRRVALEPYCVHPTNAGELNYVFTRLVQQYLGDEPSYTELNAVLGVFEAAKAEFYRRRVAPYEDKKREANGDVY